MKKKILASVLSAVMLLSLLAGCGCGDEKKSSDVSNASRETQESSDEASQNNEGDLIPVTFVRSQDPMVESNVFSNMEGATYEENIWMDLIAERLGYDIQYLWIATDGDLYTQKFNAAIATGEIPDIANVDKMNLKRLVEADLLVDLKPYYDEYASDYVKELIASAGDAAIKACTVNGVQYGLPFLDCDLETAQMIWLRQDWLDALSLTAPTTLDEFKDVLRAFMDYAGEGGVGLAMSSDLYGNQFDIKGWCNAYGAYPKYWIDDGNGGLVYGSTTLEMKEALGSLAELYEEGLVDPEFYVNDGQKANEALVNGKCGAMYGFHASSLDYLQSVVNADENADWMPYMIPMANQGDAITPGIHMCTSSWWVVSKECEHPEALIELMNLYCEKVFDPELNEYEVYSNPGNGVEGVWKLAPVNTSSPNKNQVTALAIEEPLKTGAPGDLAGEQYTMWEYSYAGQNGDRSLWAWNRVFGVDGSQQLLMDYQNNSNVNLIYDQFLGAAGEVMTAKKTTLDDMLDQAFIKIIAGQESVDAFDTVVKEWKAAGGQEMTEEVNAWYKTSK
ncbi:MAG: extracellular solute-binding protein [Lachnospiraceae bacterium]|nr:extracellular solute-binding protein [Lachnospiraceae bacterium]